jgi:hypothetical protein
MREANYILSLFGSYELPFVNEGLDICGLDFLHDEKTGKYWILELNV